MNNGHDFESYNTALRRFINRQYHVFGRNRLMENV